MLISILAIFGQTIPH